MSVPTSTLWEIEPHSLAKHAILRQYLGAWIGIMGRNNQRIVYLDGFAGPGRYKGGEKGSPIIALEIGIDHHKKGNLNEITYVFIEDNEDRFKHLEAEIKNYSLPATFVTKVEKNNFDTTIKTILDRLENRGAKLAPTFAFIDPFGYKGAPYEIIQRLLQNEKTEVFINIMVEPINRFLNHPDLALRNHIVDLYGTDKVLQINNSCGNGIQQLRELYQSQLEKCAKFVRYFEMRDSSNRVIYYLFFATNNRLGHIKMKTAFWQIDKLTGYRFSDRTNPNQMVLFDEDPQSFFKKFLMNKYKNGECISFSKAAQIIEDETAYTESHLRNALKRLEAEGCICVQPSKQNGKKRIGKTFPKETLIEFKW